LDVLDQPSVNEALKKKREHFRKFAAGQLRQEQTLDSWLEMLNEYDYQAITTQLLADGPAWPGALPTGEFDQADSLCLSFDQRWDDHQGARSWARRVLEGRTTIAVDGSQIAPSPEYRPLVGATQIGWFVNAHCESGRYVKDLAFDILSPDELFDTREASNGGDDESVATQIVNQVRFVKECERLSQLMADHARSVGNHTDGKHVDEQWPLSFFDGSFIISFAGKIDEARAGHYISAIRELLEESRRLRSPLIGFVDSSRSRDLISMLNALTSAASVGADDKEEDAPGPNHQEAADMTISDGSFLDAALKNWGDRTPLFICARNDGLSSTDRAGFYKEVLFCYMRLGARQPLARIEMPIWIYEAGLAQAVLDILCAECVIGIGYPYAIETADALAVISQQDRRRFYGMFQRFLENESLPFRQTRKAHSKRTRR
jgi:hypothetical protein